MVTQIKKRSKFLFTCFLAILIAATITRYAFGIEVPRILLTLIIIAAAFFGDRNETIAISFCCIPLHEAVDFYIALVACAVIWLAKNIGSIRIGIPVLVCVVMIVWEISHFFLPGFDFKLMLTALIPIIFLMVILSTDVSGLDYAFIIRVVAVAAISANVMLLLNCFVNSGFNIATAILNLRRLGSVSEEDILLGGAIHPNSLGVVSVLISTALFQLRSLNKMIAFDYVAVILLITFGVLTSSRTFLACLLIMTFLLILGQEGSISKKIKLLVVFALAVAVVFILMTVFFPSVLEYYIGRFDVDNIDELTTGRSGLLVDYNRFISENANVMFFGVGLADLPYKLVHIYKAAWNGPHNGIQEIILAWGIPGLILFAILICLLIVNSKRYNLRRTVINYIPLVIILVKSMAGQILSSGYTLLALALAYLSLCQNFSLKKSYKNDKLSL